MSDLWALDWLEWMQEVIPSVWKASCCPERASCQPVLSLNWHERALCMPEGALSRVPCIDLRKPSDAPRSPLWAWPDRVERTLFASTRALCQPTMALYRSVKAPFLPNREHTVGLRVTIHHRLGGPFDGLMGPCTGVREPFACLRVPCLA